MPQFAPYHKVARALCSLTVLALGFAGAVSDASAANDESSNDGDLPRPVVWELDDRTGMISIGMVRSIAGPQSPEFPDFSTANQGVLLRGRERLEIPSSGALTFAQGDSITVEAWISPQRVQDSSPRYVVGKGRTGNKGYPKDNQNWALRITPEDDSYHLSFLFATNHEGSNRYHRWTSTSTIPAGDGWHHVAIAYRFGAADSMVGWIDGMRVSGTWDMAGKTAAGPVTDDDEVWIGSAQNGSRSNSFVGAIDRVTVSREILSDEVIREQYRRDPSIPRPNYDKPAAMPEFGDLRGIVLYQMREDLPAADRWPNELDLEISQSVFSWGGDSFLLPRLPAHFDDWGIRSAYRPNVYLTIASELELPTGPNRFLLRCRSLGRLWIDGQVVAETKATLKNAPSGEEPITPLATPPHPGLRVHGYRQQEVIVEHSIEGPEATKHCRVVLELMVGGPNRRIETGEVCVAIETFDGTAFEVLGLPAERGRSLAEATAAEQLGNIEARLLRLERDQRRSLAASQDAFWESRHELARRWIEENPPPSVPRIDSREHPIDAFLRDKIDKAKAELTHQDDRAIDGKFHQTVLPVLRKHCFRCHGKATKGGLRLDSLAGMLAGGDSGWAAVEAGVSDDSELVLRLQSEDPDQKMPPDGDGPTSEEIVAIIDWIDSGAAWPREAIDPASLEPTERLSDSALLRRLFLDTVGTPPTVDDLHEFFADLKSEKRRLVIERWVDRLLDHGGFADHLMADWLDRLAENPTLLNKSLNSTGPFRFFLHDSFLDHKPLDRLVTELILMRGDSHTGGSAGFGLAGENDVPMAAKAHVLAGAFLGIEMGCARCHDAPFHQTTQSDLFSMAAMLKRKPIVVPESSRVPDAFFESQPRQSLIEVTLAPEASVRPEWTLGRLTGALESDDIKSLVQRPSDSRERLAALITAPSNTRFAAVIVNRIWHRLIGQGIVESLNDWEHDKPSHGDLLEWLSAELVANGYDIRHVIRLILTSEVYARRAVDRAPSNDPDRRFFTAPIQRRLSAEQVVDSLYTATGAKMDSEELTFVHDGRRALSNRLTLGRPRRAWMMATLNNERDRPSLSLPKARAIVDVLQAFGWNGSRQRPVHGRMTESSVLQPGILANGVLVQSLSRASLGSPLAELAVSAQSPRTLVNELFLRFLSRVPDDDERSFFVGQLRDGFEDRIIDKDGRSIPSLPPPLPLVHWFNHLRPRANEIQLEHERRVRAGPPADPRLEDDWRQRYEDVVWSLINHDEFIWMP